MKRNPCEKCLEGLSLHNCHLPCMITGLQMRALLYAYRCPDIPYAHVTTQRVQDKNRKRFLALKNNCVFWGNQVLPEELPEILKTLNDNNQFNNDEGYVK